MIWHWQGDEGERCDALSDVIVHSAASCTSLKTKPPFLSVSAAEHDLKVELAQAYALALNYFSAAELGISLHL